MHKDCIILCHTKDDNGNLLCLQEINGIPFLEYLVKYLRKFHICKVVFSISSHQDKFKEYVLGNREAFSFSFDFSEQQEFEGNGRAIMNALHYSDTPDVLIIQGHRLFDVNLEDLVAWQQTKMGDVTMALKYKENTAGNLLAHPNEENIAHMFSKGESTKSGLSVTGVYCLYRPSFLNINHAQSFSFEEDFLEKQLKERDFICMISDGYFIDLSDKGAIEKANEEFPKQFELSEKNND